MKRNAEPLKPCIAPGYYTLTGFERRELMRARRRCALDIGIALAALALTVAVLWYVAPRAFGIFDAVTTGLSITLTRN